MLKLLKVIRSVFVALHVFLCFLSCPPTSDLHALGWTRLVTPSAECRTYCCLKVQLGEAFSEMRLWLACILTDTTMLKMHFVICHQYDDDLRMMSLRLTFLRLAPLPVMYLVPFV